MIAMTDKSQLDKIDRLCQAGNIARAKVLAERFVEEHPDRVTTNMVHAIIACYERNIAVARNCLERVLDIRLGSPPALHLMKRIRDAEGISEGELEDDEVKKTLNGVISKMLKNGRLRTAPF